MNDHGCTKKARFESAPGQSAEPSTFEGPSKYLLRALRRTDSAAHGLLELRLAQHARA
jgi:hypothetical protein